MQPLRDGGCTDAVISFTFRRAVFTQLSHMREDSGQALVEFALVIPLLLLVLFAIIHFGKAFNYWNDATHLTAEGARYAEVNRLPNPTSGLSLQAQIKAQADSAELRNGGGSVSAP